MKHTNVRRHNRIIRRGKGRTTTVKKHSRRVKEIMGRQNVYIPPAWTSVTEHRGKNYLVTGVDCKGKTQYIYDPKFIQKQQKDKFGRINRLEKDQSVIRAITGDLSNGNKSKDNNKEEARAAYTMYSTGIRPGGRGRLGDKRSYGVIDLKPSQVQVNGSSVAFDFVGKKGVPIKMSVRDQRLAKVVRVKNGKLLFKTTPGRVRSYLKKKGNGSYKMKDLRTLRAQKIARKDPTRAVEKVSEALGNTPKVAKDAYINPKFIR